MILQSTHAPVKNGHDEFRVRLENLPPQARTVTPHGRLVLKMTT
ncbi:hypothetical protein PT277_02945 [Acetobacteraceae bacterium ESL0709]|nr:hypothetical protein [Acetobacteraceae bacterium ESL0697]MDF7677658.1 hypothetical protein [Acetobacteraceae bacterium ESL0709]